MNPNTAIFGAIYLLTLIVAPLIALGLQNKLNQWREARERKIWIFRTLMATRAIRLDPRHVEALNAAQLEYHAGWRNKKVFVKWKTLMDHFGTPATQGQEEAWTERGLNCLIELLYEMSRRVGYDFDTVDLKKQFYYPVAHGNIELENIEMRKGVLEILSGKRSFPMEIVRFPVDEELRKLSIEHFQGKRPIAVVVVNEKPTEQGTTAAS